MRTRVCAYRHACKWVVPLSKKNPACMLVYFFAWFIVRRKNKLEVAKAGKKRACPPLLYPYVPTHRLLTNVGVMYIVRMYTCDVEVWQLLGRREGRRAEERLHLEPVGHHHAQVRAPPVHLPDAPRRVRRPGRRLRRHSCARRRDHQLQSQRRRRRRRRRRRPSSHVVN